MRTNQQILDDPSEDGGNFLENLRSINSGLSILVILIGIFLIYDSANLYYCYNYTEIHFYIMKSELELGGDFFAGLFSVFCGIYCWHRYFFGLQSLFVFGVCLIIFSIILTLSNLEYMVENVFTAGPFFLFGILAIRYSQWKKLEWIYKK
jgi:hypothetical protein